jgi:hypothetical protein
MTVRATTEVELLGWLIWKGVQAGLYQRSKEAGHCHTRGVQLFCTPNVWRGLDRDARARLAKTGWM